MEKYAVKDLIDYMIKTRSFSIVDVLNQMRILGIGDGGAKENILLIGTKIESKVREQIVANLLLIEKNYVIAFREKCFLGFVAKENNDFIASSFTPPGKTIRIYENPIEIGNELNFPQMIEVTQLEKRLILGIERLHWKHISTILKRWFD